MSSQDFLIVQHKLAMQFCAPKFLKIPKSQCPHIFEHVFHHTNDQHHWQTLKIQLFFLSEIYTDIHLLGSCAKDSSRMFYWDLDWKKFRIGNVYLCIGNKDCSCRFTLMTSKWLEESGIWLQCGRIWWNLWILANQHHFLTMCIWDVLNVNVKWTKSEKRRREKCSNH